MTKKEQIAFINDYLDSLKEDMTEKISADKVPDSWDGVEIRRWFSLIAQDNDAPQKTQAKRVTKCEAYIKSKGL